LAVTARIDPRRPDEKPIEVRHSIAGPFSAAKEAAKMEAAARGAFEKLGDTRLTLAGFTLKNPAALFVPVSKINALRRDVTEELEKKLDSALNGRIDSVKRDVLPDRQSKIQNLKSKIAWSLKVDCSEFLDGFEAEDWRDIDEVLIDIARDHPSALLERLNTISSTIGREKIRLSLPPLTRKWEEKGIAQKVAALRAAGWNKWEAGNASAWTLLGLELDANQMAGTDLSTDWSVYVINRAAALQVLTMGAKSFVLSPEDGLANFGSLFKEFGAKAVAIVYQDTPLFLAESCAYANLIGGCPGKANCRFESMEMVSTHGEKVTAIDYHCRTIVLNNGPFCLSPRLSELLRAGAQRVRADFIYRKYDPATVRKIWRALRAGQAIPGGHAANFDRGML